MKKQILIFILFFVASACRVDAKDINAYANIVNPVRGANLWHSVDSVKKQIDYITENNLPATWLLQYDLIIDDGNAKLFGRLPQNQEIGLFLEVSEKLATDAQVAYLLGSGDWASADKVLLSGYSPSARKRMIDMIFAKFKKKFGFYPVSVGSWYVDTLSLDYMVKKYHVQAVLDVADQYSTDHYGLWGKPWGGPYIPSYFNSLLPAQNGAEKADVVKIQWAQRDPLKGYGLAAADSIYSVQANDYVNNHLGIAYFRQLASEYLFAPNPITQLTVGLEAGQEGAVFFSEYKQQLEYLKSLEKEGKIAFFTMQSFAQKYKENNSYSSKGFFVSGQDIDNPSSQAFWYSNSYYRIGFIKDGGKFIIRDFRLYPDVLLYDDIYVQDTSRELRRLIAPVIDDAVNHDAKILFEDIKKIEIETKQDTVALLLTGEGISHSVSLSADKILIDQKVFYAKTEGKSAKAKIHQILARLIIDYWINYPSYGRDGWRYSFVENKLYFGFMVAQDKLMGFNSQFPFLGIFRFPFQTLIRFKTLPTVDMNRLISAYLVNFINNSTIKIAYN